MNGVTMNTSNESTTPESPGQGTAKPPRRVAPVKKKAKKVPAKRKQRDTARVGAKAGAQRSAEGSKKAQVLELLGRKHGAALAEIMKATNWQAHTVRGFISGTLIKKAGLAVESFQNEAKDRCYRLGK